MAGSHFTGPVYSQKGFVGNLVSTSNIVTVDTSGSSAALSNTTLIQTALTATGDIYLTGTGTAYINKTLYIPSYTKITTSENLTFKLADNSNCPMFTNKWTESTVNRFN
jgi:hypothetical protein